MTDVTNFVFERLELIAERVTYFESKGDQDTAEFLRNYGKQFAHECQLEDQEFITIKDEN